MSEGLIVMMMSSRSRGVSYPDGGLVAEDFINGEPGGHIQHVLQNLLIQLQVGKMALPFQSAQINLIWGEVLSKPAEKRKRERGTGRNQGLKSVR